MSAQEHAEPVRKLVYTTRMPVRWGDMDALGHVNNTVYFRYMEQARIDWMADFFEVDSTTDIGPVLVHTQCSFLAQLKYPDEIEVQMFIGSPGRSSMETFYQMYRLGKDTDKEKTLCAEGSAKVVWVNLALGKSVPFPDAIRNRLV